MSRRNQDLTDSSLELLLDTITNSFGGIVFIAILTILLLQRTSPPQQIKELATQDQRSDMIRNQTALEEAQAEYDRLQSTIREQSKTQSKFSTPQSQSEFERIQKSRNQIAELQKRQSYVLQETALTQEQENDLLQKREKLDQDLAEAKRNSRDVTVRLKELEQQRSQDAPVPKVRETDRIAGIPVIIKHQRLYFVKDYSRGATFARLNMADFLLVEESSSKTVLSPNPTKGNLITNGDLLDKHLRQKLALVDLDRMYIDVAVWNDSFKEFQIAKTVFIKMGIPYRILMLDENGTMHFGESDGEVQ
jgi:hypothetical protein